MFGLLGELLICEGVEVCVCMGRQRSEHMHSRKVMRAVVVIEVGVEKNISKQHEMYSTPFSSVHLYLYIHILVYWQILICSLLTILYKLDPSPLKKYTKNISKTYPRLRAQKTRPT